MTSKEQDSAIFRYGRDAARVDKNQAVKFVSAWRRFLFAFCLLVLVFPGNASFRVVKSICALQGGGYSSPYYGWMVRTYGVVTLDLDGTWLKGFYMQASPCDGLPGTSDGIFVYLGESADVVTMGDFLEVSGQVNEYYGLTEILASPGDINILSSGNPLPPAVELAPPMENEAARAYFEARENMYVSLGQGRVVGPTDADERSWLVGADLNIDHVFHDDPDGTGELICSDDNGAFKIDPQVKVGDRVENLLGVLDQRYGKYCVELTAPAEASYQSYSQSRSSQSQPEFLNSPTGVTPFDVATFNLANLFDTVDDPLTEDDLPSGPAYQRHLHKLSWAIHESLGEPVLLAVQEAENVTVLQALVDQPEIHSIYDILLEDGPDKRGLDVALLYRRDRVQIVAHQVRQGCTQLVDGLGPDGNLDVENPQNEVTCDSDGNGTPDGNRLFSRPPLIVHVHVYLSGCLSNPNSERNCAEPFDVWMVICHWKSKVQDSSTIEYTLPRRYEQAVFVGEMVDEILMGDPHANLIVLGDLNDYPDSTPLAVLNAYGLVDLSTLIPRAERYTYIYEGISQVMDSILWQPQIGFGPYSATILHFNADYPVDEMDNNESLLRNSDHDPVLVWFGGFGYQSYLPLIQR